MGTRPGAYVFYGLSIGYNDGYGDNEVDEEFLEEKEEGLDKQFGCLIIRDGYPNIGQGEIFLVVKETLHDTYAESLKLDLKKLSEISKLYWDIRLENAIAFLGKTTDDFESPDFFLAPYYR